MMKRLIACLSALALSAAPLLFVGPAQSQAPAPVVHPGMSIAMKGGPLNMPNGGSTCTVAAVGKDDKGRLLGLAAGHCIPPDSNPEVQASNTVLGLTGGPVIGKWVTKPTGFPGIYTNPANQDLSHDGAFFEINPGVAVHNRLPNGVAINRIQSDGPAMWQTFCKFGQVSQTTCGLVTRAGVSPFESWMTLVLPGDSGGPAYVNNGALVGVTSAALPSRFSDITNILADSAPQGVTGFTPLQ